MQKLIHRFASDRTVNLPPTSNNMRSEVVARAFQLQARLSRTTKRSVNIAGRFQIPTEARHQAFLNPARKQGFSTSRPIYAVHVTNSRQDDDGKEKLIDITSRAAKVSE